MQRSEWTPLPAISRVLFPMCCLGYRVEGSRTAFFLLDFRVVGAIQMMRQSTRLFLLLFKLLFRCPFWKVGKALAVPSVAFGFG